jgi:hypothetical protein
VNEVFYRYDATLAIRTERPARVRNPFPDFETVNVGANGNNDTGTFGTQTTW